MPLLKVTSMFTGFASLVAAFSSPLVFNIATIPKAQTAAVRQNWLQLLVSCGMLVFTATPACAQIIPDNTLGAESSRLAPNVVINGASADSIDGGAQRGSNLFHSFSQFNVNDGQRVYFVNPSGVENILTRVTGGQASNIFGTLGVEGTANLFLINPNGILFGKNALKTKPTAIINTLGFISTITNNNYLSATHMLLTLTIWMIVTLPVLLVVLLIANTRAWKAKTQVFSLKEWVVIDLTQPLTSTIPIWPGDPHVEIQPWATIKSDGYFINKIAIGEHSGTHWATPNSFIEGATNAQQVPVEKLVAGAVVIDIQLKAAQDADYCLSVEDVRAWETANGKVSSGSVVILFTGWQDKWLSPKAFINQDELGVLHWPGFSVASVEFLVSQRQIVGLGTDTHGADPGCDRSYGASSVIYASDGIILECLASLEKLPPIGATLVVGGLPISGGSGSPARVLAFKPPAK